VSRPLFIMRWPELGKQVRLQPIEHNQEVFDWMLGNSPLRALQGHALVSGRALASLNVGLPKPFPWREKDLAKDNMATMPVGRLMLFMPAGKVVSIYSKWGEVTEPMYYGGWAQVIDEDKNTLSEVGEKIWSIFMSNKKDIVHVEFVKAEE
jgi:hypothetical protein